MTGVVPLDDAAIRRGGVIPLAVGPRDELVVLSRLEEKRRIRLSNEIERLDRLHRGDPCVSLRSLQREESTASVVRSQKMLDEATVTDREDVGGDPILHAGQETTHGGSVAYAQIPDTTLINNWKAGEDIHRSSQVDDQLDLLVTVLRREGDDVRR